MENRPAFLLRSLACFLTFTLLLALYACQTTPPSGGSSSPATLHAIHSAKLKRVMNDLSGVAFERLPQELGPRAGSGSPDLNRVAQAAASLNRSATKIPAAVGSVNLEPAEKDVFLSLAGHLKTQTAQLETQARRGDMSNARLTMRQIGGTCNSCHALFRDSAPPISFFR